MIQWNQFPPSAYQWDYIPPSAWKTLNPLAGVVPGGTNNVANFVFELGTMSLNTFLSFLQFAIDPSSLMNPIEQEIGNMLHSGYNSVFVPMIPVVVVIVTAFVLYRFIRAHHATATQIIVMFVAITGAAVYFYTNFAPAMNQITAFDDSMAGWMLNTSSELGQAASGTGEVSPNINNTLSALWDQYVVTLWEQGEFGEASSKLSDYNVSKQEVGQKWQDNNGQTKTIKKNDNWVNLLLSNNGEARTNLATILYNTSIPRAGAYANAVADPNSRLAEASMSFFLMLPIVVFIGFMSCLLLLLTLGFLFLVLKLSVTFPLAIVPDYGWNYFAKTLKQLVGVLVSKVVHATYLGLTLLIFSIVTNALDKTSNGTTMNGILVNSAICVAAIIYRGWFIRSLSQRLPKEYQWSWRKQIQKAKIETQRGTAPARNFARKAVELYRNREANRTAGVRVQAATQGAMAGRMRTTNTGRPESEAKHQKSTKPVTKGVMSNFVSENQSFTEKNQKPIRKKVKEFAPPVQRNNGEQPKEYRVKSGQSVLKSRMATMDQNDTRTKKPAPKMARRVPVRPIR